MKVFFTGFLMCLCVGVCCQYQSKLPADEWVDSVFASLNKKQRIAQLIIIRAHSNKGQGHIDSVTADIKKYKVGGLCFFQGGPVRQAVLTNLYQSIAKTPLLVTIDGEWGLGMRLDSVTNFPHQMMVGAVGDASLVYKMGKAVGEQCRLMGTHVNFAPVVDINNNPENPVINDRSFGENKYKVALFGVQYMKGMQDAGIIACAKHFPGHGDVTVDSHNDLPVILKTRMELDSLELYPFREMIKAGVKSIMIAHLFIPVIDSTPNQPTSLSHNTVTGVLRNELGYNGLTVTDGLEMKGVTKYYPSGQASVQALIAGNDLLCLPEDLKGSIKKIRKAIRKGEIDKADFEARVKKVLLAKYEAGLYKLSPIDTANLVNHLNRETNTIRTEIAENSITLLKLSDRNLLPLRGNGTQPSKVSPNDGVLPLQMLSPANNLVVGDNSNNGGKARKTGTQTTAVKVLSPASNLVVGDNTNNGGEPLPLQVLSRANNLVVGNNSNNGSEPSQISLNGGNTGKGGNNIAKNSIAYLGIGIDKPNKFANSLHTHLGATVFTFGKKDSATKALSIAALLSQYDKVVIGLHGYSRRPANRFGISPEAYNLVNNIQAKMPAITFVFGNPYAIKDLANTAKNLVACYEDDDITQELTADMLQGFFAAKGTLPVTVSPQYAYGSGIVESPMLPHDIPENVGMQSDVLNKIDSIVANAIAQKATPGCVVLVAKDGKVVFDRSYGYTYTDNVQPVKSDMIYDLASVTKVAATTIAVMKLYEEGRLDITKTIGEYLPWTKGSNKENLLITNVLLHQAGMKAWIPFYQKTVDKEGMPLPTLYRYQQNDTFSIKVAEGIFMKKDYVDSMFQLILSSNLGPDNTYEYSDNDFIFLGKIIESITGQPMEKYVQDSFYLPLQMNTTRFRPRQYFPLDEIVPTVWEGKFRQQLLRGDVHDPAAAMMGGVAGHAGLFSNAYDLAKLFQMLLNGGQMNGVRYLQQSTIEKFTAYNSAVSRRGLGFDKPEKDNATNMAPYPAAAVSPLTFGHTGFTGTCVWADPASNLIFIFLSNRVAYDKGDTNKLLRMKVRGAIQDVIYKSMGK